MMKTAEGLVAVRADGTVVKASDADRRIFHVLPKLFVDSADLERMRCQDISLKVTSEKLGVALSPEDGVVVRQPVPNRRYFIGGSGDIRYGWIVPISEDVNAFDLTLEWTIAKGAIDPNYIVRHTMDIRLLPGQYNAYSMDISCWYRVSESLRDSAPVNLQPYSRLYGDRFQEEREPRITGLHFMRNPNDDDETLAARKAPGMVVYREVFDIPAIPVSDLVSVDAFSEEQLHEVKQQTSFESGVDVHSNNACIEMPESIFVRAVQLANEIAYDDKSEFMRTHHGTANACENHPAIRLLCGWWNRHAPQVDTQCARYAMPWVRVRDDGEYWCGYYETPNAALECFTSERHANARIGDLVLIEFFKGAQDYTYDHSGFQTYYVTGGKGPSVGADEEDVKSGELDESWYALEALTLFPDRFPKAWERLVEIANR